MASSKKDSQTSSATKAWYADAGLRFECTECGQCCTVDDGYVRVNVDEISSLAELLRMSLDEFGRSFLRKVGARYALVNRVGDEGCVFLRGKRCGVYQARPAQCRSYPFWDDHLETPEAWAVAASECEGISQTAPVVSPSEIEARRRR